MLERARLAELLSYDPDTGIFTRLIARPGPKGRVGDVVGHQGTQGYVRIYVDGMPYKAHRLAWFYVYGTWPEGEIDHANCDKSDNRISNLRDVSRSQNMANRFTFRNNIAGTKGVSLARNNKWKAQIQVKGRKLGLGYFTTKEAAAAAYADAARKHFGDFARTA